MAEPRAAFFKKKKQLVPAPSLANQEPYFSFNLLDIVELEAQFQIRPSGKTDIDWYLAVESNVF